MHEWVNARGEAAGHAPVDMQKVCTNQLMHRKVCITQFKTAIITGPGGASLVFREDCSNGNDMWVTLL